MKALRQALSAWRSSDFGVPPEWGAGAPPLAPTNDWNHNLSGFQMLLAGARVLPGAPGTCSLLCFDFEGHTGGAFFLLIRHEDGIASDR
jgi:hypothetical protein